MNQRTTVVGVFHDRKMANDAIDALKSAGFRDDQIGVVGRYSDDTATGGEATTSETGTHWEGGAITGALTGAGLGALVGLGILAGMIPAVGPIIAGGTLGMMLANAAGGAAIVGLAGALVGAGIPEEEANYYESEFHSGRTIVTVKCEGRLDEANKILRRFGAYDMHTAGASSAASATGEACAAPVAGAAATATGTTRHTSGAGEKMRLHEEQLNVQKTPVQTGEVHVRKEVHTEHRTVDVPVQREEVVIERHPASGQAASSAEIGRDQDIRIPVREEQVHVTKTPVVTEEVEVGKRVVKDTEHVAGDVRKEQVKVERKGDVDVHGRSEPPDRPAR